jgi:sn-glycerol 3-phosphate transport system ATP-binding protein
MASVSLEGVRKIYASGGRTQVAVHDVDLDVADGELVVLVGPSGCGKSTTLRMIAGLETISGGRLRIGGRVVNDVPAKERDIAMVFQNYALYPHMTVADNMSFALSLTRPPKDEIRRRVAEAARILGIEQLLDRRPKALSGGQRQRVAMGRAIVREPAVFLFDEPLSNLDAKLRVQMRFEIQKLHRRLGTTSLYVTHDQVEAMTLAQRMVVMNAGRAEQIGTPMEVYQNPATVFVAGFIGSPAMNFLDGVSEGNGRIALDGGGSVVVPNAPAAGRKLTIGIRPEHLTPCKPSEANLVGSVEVIEALGADTLLHVAVAGRTIIARLPDGTPAEVGAPIALAADRERIYLFDADTGARLRS